MNGDQIYALLNYCLVALNGILGHFVRLFGARISAIDQRLEKANEQKDKILSELSQLREELAEVRGEVKVVRESLGGTTERIRELLKGDERLSESYLDIAKEVAALAQVVKAR